MKCLSFCLLCISMTTVMSGCEIGRSFLSMSSDSPTPFIGIDLIPRKKQVAPLKISGKKDEAGTVQNAFYSR